LLLKFVRQSFAEQQWLYLELQPAQVRLAVWIISGSQANGLCKRFAYAFDFDSHFAQLLGNAIGICAGHACLHLHAIIQHAFDLGLQILVAPQEDVLKAPTQSGSLHQTISVSWHFPYT
jgi:hypothetical protein